MKFLCRVINNWFAFYKIKLREREREREKREREEREREREREKPKNQREFTFLSNEWAISTADMPNSVCTVGSAPLSTKACTRDTCPFRLAICNVITIDKKQFLTKLCFCYIVLGWLQKERFIHQLSQQINALCYVCIVNHINFLHIRVCIACAKQRIINSLKFTRLLCHTTTAHTCSKFA